ncbi:MAG: IS5 family transposase [Thermomicrobiales bacterium]
MPAMPVSLMEPIWAQAVAVLPDHPAVDPAHPLGCHRRRIPDRVVFEHVVAALVHGSGYERIATSGCSDRTIRRRVHEWADAGLMQLLHGLILAQYDRMIVIEVEDVAVDGCITKAPGGGEKAGRSPVDRGKQGLKRSTLTDATGIPLHVVASGANDHDGPLLGPTLAGLAAWGGDPADTTVHLDRGYDSQVTRTLLANLALTGEIARKGKPAPLQVGSRWVVERTHAWMNGYGKLRRCTERVGRVVDFYLFLAAVFVVVRCLIQRARSRSRWDGQPTTRRLT